eukprot:scaffold62017_cov51-Attheya_sp.AAC.6
MTFAWKAIREKPPQNESLTAPSAIHVTSNHGAATTTTTATTTETIKKKVSTEASTEASGRIEHSTTQSKLTLPTEKSTIKSTGAKVHTGTGDDPWIAIKNKGSKLKKTITLKGFKEKKRILHMRVNSIDVSELLRSHRKSASEIVDGTSSGIPSTTGHAADIIDFLSIDIMPSDSGTLIVDTWPPANQDVENTIIHKENIGLEANCAPISSKLSESNLSKTSFPDVTERSSSNPTDCPTPVHSNRIPKTSVLRTHSPCPHAVNANRVKFCLSSTSKNISHDNRMAVENNIFNSGMKHPDSHSASVKSNQNVPQNRTSNVNGTTNRTTMMRDEIRARQPEKTVQNHNVESTLTLTLPVPATQNIAPNSVEKLAVDQHSNTNCTTRSSKGAYSEMALPDNKSLYQLQRGTSENNSSLQSKASGHSTPWDIISGSTNMSSSKNDSIGLNADAGKRGVNDAMDVYNKHQTGYGFTKPQSASTTFNGNSTRLNSMRGHMTKMTTPQKVVSDNGNVDENHEASNEMYMHHVHGKQTPKKVSDGPKADSKMQIFSLASCSSDSCSQDDDQHMSAYSDRYMGGALNKGKSKKKPISASTRKAFDSKTVSQKVKERLTSSRKTPISSGDSLPTAESHDSGSHADAQIDVRDNYKKSSVVKEQDSENAIINNSEQKHELKGDKIMNQKFTEVYLNTIHKASSDRKKKNAGRNTLGSRFPSSLGNAFADEQKTSGQLIQHSLPDLC